MRCSDRHKGAVYFLQVREGGPIKIGYTTGNPYCRVQALQHASPYILDWIGYVEGPFAKEASLHRKFERHRIRSEWFHPASEILAHIATICPEFTPEKGLHDIFSLDEYHKIEPLIPTDRARRELFRNFLNWDVIRDIHQWREKTKAPTKFNIKRIHKALIRFHKKSAHLPLRKPKRKSPTTGHEANGQI